MAKSTEEIRLLQESLNADGFLVEIDGIDGPMTREAVRRRQLVVGDASVSDPVDQRGEFSPAKPWWLSKAVLGAVGVIVTALVGMFGFSVDSSQMSEFIQSGVTFVMGAIALYGTFKRKSKIDTRRVLPGVSLPDRRVRTDGVQAIGRQPAENADSRDPGPFLDS